jgi:hypothetical protein
MDQPVAPRMNDLKGVESWTLIRRDRRTTREEEEDVVRGGGGGGGGKKKKKRVIGGGSSQLLRGNQVSESHPPDVFVVCSILRLSNSFSICFRRT